MWVWPHLLPSVWVWSHLLPSVWVWLQVGSNVPSNTAGIVTPPHQLLPSSRVEILDLMRTAIEKSQQKLALQLLEVSL